MRVVITINCDNAAFNDDNGPEDEVARILLDYARQLADGLTNVHLASALNPRKLRDRNGNTVGTVEVTE